jgi:hypothetical protein
MPIITQDGPATPEVIFHADPEATRTTTEHTTSIVATSGSSLETLGGAGAVVLAIIALAGYLPFTLTTIACIAVGGAVVAHGSTVAARWNATFGSGAERTVAAGGLGSEVLGGLGGITLGILALVGVLPMLLLPIAAIVLGGAVLFGAPTMALAGIGSAVLGILALLHVGPPVVLSVVAMLALGGALVLSGGVLTTRFARHLENS